MLRKKNNAPHLLPGATEDQVLESICSTVPEGELIDTEAKIDIQILQGVEAFLQHATNHNSGVRFFKETFYIYTSTHWIEVSSKMLSKHVSGIMSRLGFHEQECRTSTVIKKVRAQLEDSALTWNPRLRKEASVNCMNGTVIIDKDGSLTITDHYPEDYYTYCLPYEYDHKARAPKFMNFLEQSLPGIPERLCAIEAIGAAFVGDLKLEKMVIMLGTGANGKSVFTDVVTSVLGSHNVCNYSLDDLDGDDTKMSIIDSKLLNYASEIGSGMKPDTLKRLASREPITVRPIYKTPIELRDYCRFVFNANQLPVGQSGHAYERRFIIVPWENTVAKEDRDPDLANKIIKDELPGILNMIIQGARRLLKAQRYTHSEKSDKALEEYRFESDSVAEWLNESQLGPGVDRQATTDVYSRYSSFCSGVGRKPVSKNKFSRRLESLGIKKGRTPAFRYYLIGTAGETVSTTDAPF